MVSVRAPVQGLPPPVAPRPIRRHWVRFGGGALLVFVGSLQLMASLSDATVSRRAADEHLREEVQRLGIELQRTLAHLQSTLDGLEDVMDSSASPEEKESQRVRTSERFAPLVASIAPPGGLAREHRLSLLSARRSLQADIDTYVLRDRLGSRPLMDASLHVTLFSPGESDMELPEKGWLHASLVVPLPGKQAQDLVVSCRIPENDEGRALQAKAIQELSVIAWSSYDNVFGPLGNQAYASPWMLRIQEAAGPIPGFEGYELRAPDSAPRETAPREVYRIPLAGRDRGVVISATQRPPELPLLGIAMGAGLLLGGLALGATGAPFTRETTLGAAAMQAAPGMLLAGDDGRVRIANESAARLVRGSDGSVPLPDLLTAIVRRQGDEVVPAWGELSRARQDGPAVPDLLLRNAAGELVPVVHASRTADGLLLVLDGASPLPTLRQQLIASEEHLRAVMEGVPAPLFEVNAELEIVHINAAAAALAAVEPDAAKGTRCHATLFHLDLPCPGCPLAEVLATRHTAAAPPVTLPEGRAFDRTLVFLPSDTPSAVEYLRDRSEEEKLREELGVSEQHARIGHLAASVAHDLRNPLLVISAAAESLRSLGLGERPRELTGYILEEVHRLDSFTRDILDYARTEVSSNVPFVLGVIASSAVSAMAPLRREHRVEVETHLGTEEKPVLGDPEQIRRALVNLLSNAVQFAGEQGRVVVTSGGDAERGWVRIEDSGPGIPPERAEDVFRPFMTTRRGGTGLGLPIARRLVEQCGGRLRLVPGQLLAGAAFELSLPRRQGR